MEKSFDFNSKNGIISLNGNRVTLSTDAARLLQLLYVSGEDVPATAIAQAFGLNTRQVGNIFSDLQAYLAELEIAQWLKRERNTYSFKPVVATRNSVVDALALLGDLSVEDKLTALAGQQFTIDEIAEGMNLLPNQVRKIINANNQVADARRRKNIRGNHRMFHR